MTNRPEAFLLLAARRSGTTFFLDCLDSHSQLWTQKRAFDVTVRMRYFVRPDPQNRFARWVREEPRRRVDALLRRRRALAAFVADQASVKPGKRALVIRVSYEQARIYPDLLDWATAAGVGILHLVRHNSLKTLVSRATSQKRRLRHSRERVAPVTVHLPPRAVLRRLRTLTGEVEHYRRRLADARALEVGYEEFVRDHENYSRKILEFLGADPAVPLRSDLVKINPDSLKQVIENYAEVENELRGTRFAAYLD